MTVNKFVLSSSVFAFSLFAASSVAFASAGKLDPTFGNDGIIRTDFSNLGSNFGFSGAALAPTGDIVVSGTLQNVRGLAEVGVIVKYLSDGSLDPSFGTGGIVVLPPPSNVFLGLSFTMGVAVQSDGRVLTLFGTTNNSGTVTQSLLLRVNSNGQLDSSFGSGGQVLLNFPAPANFGVSATSISIQPDGKILLAGAATPPFRSTASALTLLARYLSNGTPDQSFGKAGIVETVAVGLPNAVSVSSSNILVANFAGEIAEFSSTGALLRVSAVTAPINVDQPGTFLANGELLVATTVPGPFKSNQDAIVKRYSQDGLDSTFRSAVIRVTPDAPFVHNTPVGIGIDTDDRIIVGLVSGVARLNANGSLDSTFGSNGIGTVVPSTPIRTVLVQSNNDVVAIGNGVLLRYLGQ